MTMNPGKENQLMIARLLGMDEEEAAALLDVRVVVRAGAETYAVFAKELSEQLQRTVVLADDISEADVEIVVGIEPSGELGKVIYISLDDDGATFSETPMPIGDVPELHGLQIVLGACYAASYVLGRAISGLPSPSGDFRLSFAAIGADRALLEQSIVLTGTALAGAGAVGNGLLRGLRHLDVKGELTVVDPKTIGGGNANRCLFFEPGETGPKAEVLSNNAQASFAHLELKPFVGTFHEYVEREGRVRQVLVATDSRPVRRSIQNDLPLVVVDASTTGVNEIIVHSHEQPTEGACLACIYKHVLDEDAKARDIASGLGIEVSDVDPNGLIGNRVADLIVAAHPDLHKADLLGKAFDTLFKELCGEMALLTPSGEQALAPFAFVSNMAGAYLALELVRRTAGVATTNYMFLDPWRPPYPKLRSFRTRDSDCQFCGKRQTQLAFRAVWPDVFFD
ncbi:ThiF family adenylyltransferase [Rhizobium ruizarguesonis]|uniref:THIF-type NAD/FAD binding fold domain-containing protein n=1 Tax=Rhizobium ruizarguesonis TaxID=2081791 RepID=A0AAE4YYQ1_9HYPH|nr:ThiF family adenylyltransferase [Rhizobium ruizarguesonis]QIJ44773.1 hypothetical protein G7039_31980 [Rhizobium leguminosarum]TCB50263.1 hypothetical protein E0J20_25240 [Rhizobium leguminosarum bv. viciae]NEI24985.1 hypothetical protein [Rhizobium ruizarguesonis]NEI53059.1 hypothetical protein [Rhizobium ruizarguesonis]TAU15466.1 hypothetical protein ELI47_38260 [Rhizobium ruizarguesonis]